MNAPYEEGECKHSRTFDKSGRLTCLECVKIYDEYTLCWVDSDSLDVESGERHGY